MSALTAADMLNACFACSRAFNNLYPCFACRAFDNVDPALPVGLLII